MEPYYQRAGVTLYHADCVDALRELPVNAATAFVTDPPYGLDFMGKEWDGVVPGVKVWREALRVLAPGGHMLAFGGTRTFHRLACAIEDAGFEIRDCLSWLYGQGFPKSLDVARAIDEAAGAKREVERVEKTRYTRAQSTSLNVAKYGDTRPIDEDGYQLKVHTLPATDQAKRWSGYGTALKPAWEPVLLARKPLCGTVERNVREHGAGALNVDGCRIGVEPRHNGPVGAHRHSMMPYEGSEGPGTDVVGRWPANLILDDAAAAMVDESTEEVVHGAGHARAGSSTPALTAKRAWQGPELQDTGDMHRFGDSGGASRFFYCAKASDRDILPAEELPLFGESHVAVVNSHPTVKPVELMRWLVRLVTMPGGREANLIVDPFAGSGSTLVAALIEGCGAVGIEREERYCEIIVQRLEREARG
jgi:site-specific DNA-methyltransferase (adenine-specific)